MGTQIENKTFLTGGINAEGYEAYEQAVTEGMIDPKAWSAAKFRDHSDYERFGKPLKPLTYDKAIKASALRIAHLFGTPRQREQVAFEWLGEDNELPPLVPTTLAEQLALMPGTHEERVFLLTDLQNEIIAVLQAKHIRIYSSSARVKTEESIAGKQQRRISKDLLMQDIFGVRMVIPGFQMILASNLIFFHYWPPRVYPWGRESIIYYSKSEAGEVTYEARHIVIPFGRRTGMQHIAEVQLLTPEQAAIANASRKAYEHKLGKK